MPIIEDINYFIILRPMKNDIRFKYVPWKNLWFCFTSIVWVHFSHKTENFRFWKSLKYEILCFLIRKEMAIVWYVPWKNVRFCFIFIVWVHFSHKTEKWFWESLKYSKYFLIKKMIPDLNISSQRVSDLN